MNRQIAKILAVTVLGFVGCSQLTQPIDEFRLHSECAKLAEKVEQDNPKNDAHDVVDWSSNYDSQQNRCYVLATFQDRPSNVGGNTLYDGPTGKKLAFTSIGPNGMAGEIEDGNQPADCSPSSDCGYQNAQKYIAERIQPKANGK